MSAKTTSVAPAVLRKPAHVATVNKLLRAKYGTAQSGTYAGQNRVRMYGGRGYQYFMTLEMPTAYIPSIYNMRVTDSTVQEVLDHVAAALRA